MRLKIEERDASGKTIATYDSIRIAAETLNISPGTIKYSMSRAGHVVSKTQTSFHAVEDRGSRCGKCVYREYYNIGGQRICGCGYGLKTGELRGGKVEDCTKWEEDIDA